MVVELQIGREMSRPTASFRQIESASDLRASFSPFHSGGSRKKVENIIEIEASSPALFDIGNIPAYK